jgi:hypothetical protein
MIADPFGSDVDEDEAQGGRLAPWVSAGGPFVPIPSAAPTPQIASVVVIVHSPIDIDEETEIRRLTRKP